MGEVMHPPERSRLIRSVVRSLSYDPGGEAQFALDAAIRRFHGVGRVCPDSQINGRAILLSRGFLGWRPLCYNRFAVLHPDPSADRRAREGRDRGNGAGMVDGQ
jgi:hypothetical protein